MERDNVFNKRDVIKNKMWTGLQRAGARGTLTDGGLMKFDSKQACKAAIIDALLRGDAVYKNSVYYRASITGREGWFWQIYCRNGSTGKFDVFLEWPVDKVVTKAGNPAWRQYDRRLKKLFNAINHGWRVRTR